MSKQLPSYSSLLAFFPWFIMDGKPWCVCGRRKLTRLSDNMLLVWADYEGERWYWHTDAQAYFRLCKECHGECWVDDMRCQGPACRPRPPQWHKWLAPSVEGSAWRSYYKAVLEGRRVERWRPRAARLGTPAP